MQSGVRPGALRPFPRRFQILSHLSLMRFWFEHVHEKAFSQSFDLQEHLIKPSLFDYLHLFLVAYLNRFEKVAVPNEHLVSASRITISFIGTRIGLLCHSVSVRIILYYYYIYIL